MVYIVPNISDLRKIKHLECLYLYLFFVSYTVLSSKWLNPSRNCLDYYMLIHVSVYGVCKQAERYFNLLQFKMK